MAHSGIVELHLGLCAGASQLCSGLLSCNPQSVKRAPADLSVAGWCCVDVVGSRWKCLLQGEEHTKVREGAVVMGIWHC